MKISSFPGSGYRVNENLHAVIDRMLQMVLGDSKEFRALVNRNGGALH